MYDDDDATVALQCLCLIMPNRKERKIYKRGSVSQFVFRYVLIKDTFLKDDTLRACLFDNALSQYEEVCPRVIRGDALRCSSFN